MSAPAHSTKAPARVALVTNVLAHYRVPCFQALAARLPGRIDYLLLTDSMAHRRYVLAQEDAARANLPLRVLHGRGFHRPPFDDVHLNDLRPALQGYDLLILGGWAEPSYLLLWTLALVLRKRYAFWVESTQYDAPRSARKEQLKRQMLARAAGAVVAGTRAAEYVAGLGLPPAKIFRAPNAVNTDYFHGQAAALLPRRQALRGELGIERTAVLFVGRMVEELKHVSQLLDAQQQLERNDVAAELLLVGEGPDRAGYEQKARALGLRHVRFVDFQPHDVLCRYYAAADVFVLPSRNEPWGFVLNEAMEFGLPLVVSENVGAAPELVCAGENGFVLPYGDTAVLVAALTELVNQPELRARMGSASQSRIAPFTPAAWADGFAHGIAELLR